MRVRLHQSFSWKVEYPTQTEDNIASYSDGKSLASRILSKSTDEMGHVFPFLAILDSQRISSDIFGGKPMD